MASDDKEPEKKDYQILGEDFPTYDYSFKIIVIGDSGKTIIQQIINKYQIYLIKNNRCGKIIFINTSSETYFLR
jgi:hypothetical protein